MDRRKPDGSIPLERLRKPVRRFPQGKRGAYRGRDHLRVARERLRSETVMLCPKELLPNGINKLRTESYEFRKRTVVSLGS